MFKREDFSNIPTKYTMREYINNSLWEDFCQYMKNTYYVIPKFEFSKCNLEYGWNIKFKKGSKSLCTIYPREKYFCVMVVIGQKEKERFERILPSLSADIQKIYEQTKEGNGQKWLMIDLEDNDQRYEDIKRMINIRVN